MDINNHWPEIQSIFQNAQSTCRHCTIATVKEDGSPHITPIGSLILRDDCSDYFFEEYSQKMTRNFKQNNRICILAVNSGTRYWFKAIFTGRFSSPPGVRLYGTVGQRRLGTEEEISSFQNRVKTTRKLKGYKLIWKNMKHIREINFESFEPVHVPKMTKHLWRGC